MGEHEPAGHTPSPTQDVRSLFGFLQVSLENKKRKTNQTSTSRAPPEKLVQPEENIIEDDINCDALWDNLNIEEDKDPTPQ